MTKCILQQKANQYAHSVYKLCSQLSKEESFGIASQLKRAALSVPLNIVEGYSRQSAKSEAQFLTIAYGSLKECQYLLVFTVEEKLMSQESVRSTLGLGEEVAKMLWVKTKTLKAKS